MPGTSCSQNGNPLQVNHYKLVIENEIKLTTFLYKVGRMKMKLPICPFTFNEGSNSETNIESLTMNFFYESHQVISAAKIVLSYGYIYIIKIKYFLLIDLLFIRSE